MTPHPEQSSRTTASACVVPMRLTAAPAAVTLPENCTYTESFRGELFCARARSQSRYGTWAAARVVERSRGGQTLQPIDGGGCGVRPGRRRDGGHGKRLQCGVVGHVAVGGGEAVDGAGGVGVWGLAQGVREVGGAVVGPRGL